MRLGREPAESVEFLSPGPEAIPADLAEVFYPASAWLLEWRTYWLRCEGADRVRIGDEWIKPVTEGLFPVRFENRLGLAALQPFAGPDRVGDPIDLEVVSPKFGDLQEHRRFYASLLDELFSSAARLPFAFHSSTARGAGEANAPASALFTYHFLRHSGDRLRQVLAAIQSRPHRELDDRLLLSPLARAEHIDADVLSGIVIESSEWQRSNDFPLSRRMGGVAPARVLQRRPYETFDTPLNRFAAAFLREMLAAARSLPTQTWWASTPPSEQQQVLETTGLLQAAAACSPFSGAGPMELLPAEGLVRREGYRVLLLLWQSFQTARQPLFGRLQHAIEVRDISTLYEIWVFFRLVEEIGSLVGLPAEGKDLELKLSDESGLGWRALARFGSAGTLIYNLDFAAGVPAGSADDFDPRSYSVPLRPDFTWVVNGQPEVVLDAKFRLDRPLAREGAADKATARARSEDLYKMHAYRDALGVRAAVVLYPGEDALFYHQDGKAVTTTRIDRILRDPIRGVGATPLRPQMDVSEQG